MFTGIIETIGEVVEMIENNTNITFQIKSPISNQLKIDQSVAHNGVCLTVEKITEDSHFVTAIAETLQVTNLTDWKIGKKVNIERCMAADSRFDGHIVQGHIDTIVKCVAIENKNGSWEYTFGFDEKFAAFIVEKGSVTLNGTSLTVFAVTDKTFKVAIIPYTYSHTTIHDLKIGDNVNIEFDIIGKYVNRIFSFSKK